MDKLTELVDAVERRTLSIDRDKAEEEALAEGIEAVVHALRRLLTVCQGAGWQRHDNDAIAEAEAALAAFYGLGDESDILEGEAMVPPPEEPLD